MHSVRRECVCVCVWGCGEGSGGHVPGKIVGDIYK